MRYRPFFLPLFLAALSTASFTVAQTSKEVRQVTIRSGWGGLGTPQDVTATIFREGTGFVRDRKPVAPSLIHALVNSLAAPRIAKPDVANLGIDEAWLKLQVSKQQPRSFAQATATTKGQQALFEKSFTDPVVASRAIPHLFDFWKSDDYPGVKVEVLFEDGSRLAASTHSYYVFMLPWGVGDEKDGTYNADISRAVSALLPPKVVNKERLNGSGLQELLTEAVMSSIETKWNLQGAEEMVGGALAELRQNYQVTATEITPYHHPEYGTETYKGEQEEMNLHVLLRKPSFPQNVADAVVLKDVKGQVEAIGKFLSSSSKYEDLVFSVPWLKDYIHEHPHVFFRISYVHDASFGEKAMRTFAGDMKLRERGDLIEKVRAQQSQIALLIVGTTYAESYWLLFPDKHILLWRYQGPSGLLKWTSTDFGEGECADYRVNNGGCSGREVKPDGNLIPEGTLRDVSCVASRHSQNPQTMPPPGELFEVENHDRGGFIDRTGAVVIPLCFDAVGDFSDGLARFERDGKWGFIDAMGKIVIQPVFPWAEDFHEELAHVQVTGEALGYDGKWGYIDKTGKVVIAPDYQRVMGDDDGVQTAFHEGLAMVEVEGKSIPPKNGFIDKTGKLVIPARFTYASPFSEGFAAVTESDSGDSGWGYIDKTGAWAIPPEFEWTNSFEFGLAAVNRKKNCGYIEKSGAFVIHLPAPGGKEDCASAWGDFSDGLSRWLFGTKYGFIDRSGKTVIEPRFDLTFGFSEGLAAVQIGKKWGYIDTTGKMVIEPQDLSFAKPFHNGLTRVGIRDNGWAYLNRSGKYVWQSAHQGAD